MTVNIIFNPRSALILFSVGVWMAITIDPLFGLMSIIGGSLQGFSILFGNNVENVEMNEKSKVLLYASFVFLLCLMSIAYLAISIIYL